MRVRATAGPRKQTIAAAIPNGRLIAGDVFGSVAKGLALDAARRFAER